MLGTEPQCPSALGKQEYAKEVLLVWGNISHSDYLLPEDQYLDMFDSESDISGDNSEDELVEVL